MDLELRHFRCLLAIANEQSITGAARSLHMTQPALSRTLRQLEDELGVRLVDRSTRHLVLTSEGEAFRDKAELAMSAIADALDVASLQSRPLRVGHAWSAIGEHTSEILRQWSIEHPNEPLELRRFDDRTAGLTRGVTDIAILRGPIEESGIRLELLFEESRVAAIPKGNELATHSELRLEELVSLPIVINVVSGTGSLQLWDGKNTTPDSIEVSNADDWLMVVASGRGIGVTPSSSMTMYPHPDVAYVPLIDAPPVPVWLAWRQDARHTSINDFAAIAFRVVAKN